MHTKAMNTKTSKPDKLNCSQSSTANNQNSWRSWTAGSILSYSLPVWN